jgi:CBS domain-containing protein
MRAKHIMTRDVVTLAPETSVRDAARALVTHRISAAPVVDADGRLVGIVSEGDLMLRADPEADRPRSWWLSLLTSSEDAAAAFVKSHARRVADVMTRDLVTVEEDTPLAEVARTLEERHIKRVPVVRGGRLVGIVARADLVRAVASAPEPVWPMPSPSDEALRERVIAALRDQSWAGGLPISVIAKDGVVELWGFAETETRRKAVRLLVEEIPGVQRVEDHLGPVPLPAYYGGL